VKRSQAMSAARSGGTAVTAPKAPATGAAQAAAALRRRAGQAPRGRRPIAGSQLGPVTLLKLQREAGNQAVTGLVRAVQRVGGWSGADPKAGKGLASGEPATGWNVGEHAVGSIRRIPIDGLTHGLQSASSADGGKSLTTENVAGSPTGPARSEAAEREGRGRAVALIPSAIRPDLPVDVLFHLHGNTEHAGRGYAGWRQHKDTGAVRDVDRDRIAQQIEGTKSPQLVGILPMGMNQSQFGAISPDSYIRDAFDRLAELGAWKAAPQKFRVVLSAHSGGGFTVEKMMRGRKGFQLPQNLGMIILFEANNNLKGLKRGEQQAFTAWAIGQLNAHLAVLTSTTRTDPDKRAYLAQATRLRAFFDPRKGHSYGSIYGPLRTAIADWFTVHGAKLGAYLAETRTLLQIVEQSEGHEGQMRAGLGSALSALPGTPRAGSPSGTPGGTAQQPVPTTAPAAGPATGGAPMPVTGSTAAAAPLTTRAAAITAAMVGQRAGSAAPIAMLAFTTARGNGAPPLQAASVGLATAGTRDPIDLTDALFALVRPELGGGRIPADREDLKREWRQLRSSYARPALAPTAGPGGAAGPASAGPAAGKGTGKVGEAGNRPADSTGTTTPAAPVAAAGSPEKEYEAFSGDVKKAFGKSGLKRYLAVRDLYGTRKETAGNPAQWLNQLRFGVAFCGTSLNGVHPNLLAALKKVDEEVTKLAAQVRASGAPVVFQGDFQPRAVTGKPDKLSDHALGLALHLNYKNNPYIGRNKAASALIARLAEQAGQEKFWSSIKGSGRRTTQDRVEEIYRSFAAASDAVAKYFLEMDALEVKAKAGELDAAGQEELRKRTKEYWQLRNSDLAKHRDPRNGIFLHTTGVEGDPMLEIIKQLSGPAGLEWGGTYGGQAKDLHHFALKG
jgi:hypothetical protein